MDNVFLNHSGIKGMKWGIRRFQNKDGSLTPAGRKRYADNDRSESRSVKDMSDSELRQAINRLQMEKQYAQLTKKEINPGLKIVTDILANSAKQTASNYVSKYMTKGVDIAIGKIMNK